MKKENYYISVGEPWDFESKDGQNIVKGKVLDLISKQCLVFKSNHCLQFDNIEGNILILTPRYNNDFINNNDFSNLINDLVVINGGILLMKYDEQISEKELLENSKFVIIGSIKKE